MKTVAVIPARGGSKEVPRKNAKLLNDKPLIAWTIEAALRANTVDRVIVSTDDADISVIAKQYGSEVIQRPPEISTDDVSSEEALLHALRTLKGEQQYEPELLIFLQCTSPLMTSSDIDGVVHKMIKERADSALTVAPFHSFIWKSQPEGTAVGINHNAHIRKLRQHMDPQFIETGAVYVMRVKGFLEAKHRFFNKISLYVIPKERCLEIDDYSDFHMAEMLLKKRLDYEMMAVLPKKIGAVVFDFDGVFTDNRVLVMQNGSEAVVCHRSDGMGLAYLRQKGIPIMVLTSEINPVVRVRCEKIGVPCLVSVNDKISTMRKWLKQQGSSLKDTIYVGNDVNDLDCLKHAGCGIAVANAHPLAKKAADIILSRAGGDGAIRELVEIIERKEEVRDYV